MIQGGKYPHRCHKYCNHANRGHFWKGHDPVLISAEVVIDLEEEYLSASNVPEVEDEEGIKDLEIDDDGLEAPILKDLEAIDREQGAQLSLVAKHSKIQKDAQSFEQSEEQY